MKTRNSTKSKLLSSVIALVLCVSMLIGATFAWFTDTASTAVNKIQAGNLDIQLLAEDGTTSLEGKTLSWQKADGYTGESVLWEPGCTYFTDGFQIKNAGDLNLKFKIAVNGITSGDATLLNAIDFYLTTTKSNDLSSTGAIPLNSFTSGEFKLAPGKFWKGTTDSDDTGSTPMTIYLAGHMKEDAGNEYQGLSIDGIGITLYATQLTAESDSFGNTYDQNAEYNKRHATLMDETTGKTITLEKGKTYTVGNATVTVEANGNITYTDSSTTPQTVTINTDGGTLTVNAPNATVNHYGESDNVVITAVAGNSYHEFGKVAVLELAKGRVVVENGDNIGIIQVKANNAENNPVVIAVPQNVVLDTKIEKASGVENVNLKVINSNGADTTITTTNGITNETIPVELKEVLVSQGQTGTIGEAKDYVARIGNEPYKTLADAVVANKSGNIVLMSNIELTSYVKITDNRTIDMNGYNISSKNTWALFVKGSTLNLIGKGVVSATGESMSGDRSVIFVGNTAQSSGLIVGKDVTVSTDKCYGITYYGEGNQEVVIDGTVSVTGPSPAISGNGTYNGATVTVNGTVSSQSTNAIYNPQGGTLTVNGTVSGTGGIEAKAGNVVVNDGAKITATASSTSHKADGNGCSTDGYAIAVVNNSGYKHGPAHVTVNGGTVIGDLGIVDDNATTSSGSITITGGSFTDLVSALKYAASDATIGLAQDAQGGGLGSADGAKVRENLTIDFNGHTYTVVNNAVGSPGTKSQAMHWGKSLGAITLKNGTFKVASGADNVKMAMQNYINFTAENMNFDFSAIPVSHYGEYTGENAVYNHLEVPMFNANGAPITMKNCTVKMPAESTKGITADEATITLNNCTIDGYVCCVDTGSTVINNGSTWKGFVSYFGKYEPTHNGNVYSVGSPTHKAE